MGGHSEKLLTLQDAANQLSLSEEALRALIDDGSLPTFMLGGQHLRLRQRDLDRLVVPSNGSAPAARRPKKPKQKQKERVRSSISSTVKQGGPLYLAALAWDRTVDFFYFNNFYLVALLILLTLVAIIYAL